MSLADAAIRRIVDSLTFRGSAAPYLLVDTQLRIRAVNLAYLQATLHDGADIIGELMFDVFPDNPATPDARAVEHLGSSFEHALITGAPHRMGMQRYDVINPGTGGFVEKTWLPNNSPIRDADGRIVGVLHHVEDVTHLLVDTDLERGVIAPGRWRGQGPMVGMEALGEASRRDSSARRVRAKVLVEESRKAMERMVRRIEASDEE
jgi:hypothetical protein